MKIKYLLSAFPVLLISLSGCKKDKGPPITGEVTINSTLYGEGPYYALGYSFSQGELVKTNAAPGPDIAVLPQANADKTAVEWVILNTNNMNNSFSLTASFDNVADAGNFFSHYQTVNDSTVYTGLAKDIQPNQIWTFRTYENKYVKLLILKVVTRIDNHTPYAETTFRYVYQPNGSRTFPE